MRGKYTEDQALQYFADQGPIRVEGTLEVRMLPETPADYAAMFTSAFRNGNTNAYSGWAPDTLPVSAATPTV